MTNLAGWPVLTPLLGALVTMGLQNQLRVQRWIALGCAAANAALVAWLLPAVFRGDRVLVLPLGGWTARIGVVWVVDGLSLTLLLGSAIVLLGICVFLTVASGERPEGRFLYPLVFFMFTGIQGCAVAGDLFNLFVFLEIMIISSFVLAALGQQGQALRRILPYVIVSLVSSSLFLAGVGLSYASTGTVNLAELSARLREGSVGHLAGPSLSLLAIALFIKTALFPFFTWLPASYPWTAASMNAVLAPTLTKVGVYLLFRLFQISGASEHETALRWLGVLGLSSMLVGAFGALGQRKLRHILSFDIISQLGYPVYALSLSCKAGTTAGIYFLLHLLLVEAALFSSAAMAELTWDLSRSRGLGKHHPLSGTGFALGALAAAGVPPFSGFFAKLAVISAGLSTGAWLGTAIALFTSFLTLAVMCKIWAGTYGGEPEGLDDSPVRPRGALLSSSLGLAGAALLLGLASPLVFPALERAADQVHAPHPYLRAVLDRQDLKGAVLPRGAAP